MRTAIFVALALACVCSPALAATLASPPNSSQAIWWGAITGVALGFAIGFGIWFFRIQSPARQALCFAAMVATVIFAFSPALAQVATSVGPEPVVSASTVTAPIGSWTLAIAQWLNVYIVPALAPIVAAYLIAVVRKLHPLAAMFLSQRRVEMMIQSGADYGLNAVKGAAKGKTLSFDVSREVIARGTQYLLDNAPAKAIELGGGPDGIAKRIFRTLNLDEAASAENTLEPVLRRLPAVKVAA